MILVDRKKNYLKIKKTKVVYGCQKKNIYSEYVSVYL